jgi:cytoskeleton protein RodZ
MTTELTQPSSAVTALSAGQTLRQAREQQQLSVAQVAQQLNLSKSLIEDLEQDRVDAKLSSTFVRGYLRSYAKLLKLPIQQVLEAYSSNAKGLHQIPSLTRSFSKRTATEATENRFMWVTYFVIFVFIVLLVVGFWQSRFGSGSASTALPMAQTDESMLATQAAQATNTADQPLVTEQSSQSLNEIPVTQLDHSPTATESPALAAVQQAPAVIADSTVPTQQQGQTASVVQNPVVTAPEASTVQSTTEPLATTTDTPVVSQSPVSQSQSPRNTELQGSEPQSSAPQNEVEQSTATQGPAEQVTAMQTQPVVEQPVATATGTDTVATAVPAAVTTEAQTSVQADANATISLALSAECWVDVVDATGKRLVFGSRKSGEQLNVRGVAPIKVLLGNAAAATLSFNGESIDLSGYPAGRVARLTLGQN